MRPHLPSPVRRKIAPLLLVAWALIGAVSTDRCGSCGFGALGLSLSTPPSQPPRRRKNTRVKVSGDASAPVVPLQTRVNPIVGAGSDDLSLTSYMRLPVEQYVLIPMPLGSSLSRREKSERREGVGDEERTVQSETSIPALIASTESSASVGEEFELVVPTINFFGVTVQPVVFATVRSEEDRVLISSHKCVLRGSEFIEKVKLNDRFDFRVEATLTWSDPVAEAISASSELPYTEITKFRDGSISAEDVSRGDAEECCISVTTLVDVNVDVPRPFNRIPKRAMESMGNAAVRLSIKYIQGNFVENLAKDYRKWATDEAYRKFRASLSEPLKNVDEFERENLILS